ncbi:MAG TPA: sugar ABC transporter ATP-binding protein [Aggregatilineaceae bacterium]|nr:sugar ABC transporter ATP-binding protein [Aggregatilineaceae bacterium]
MADTLAEHAEQAQTAPGRPEQVILRAENITKVFPGTIALDQVDFNVYRGKVNVLVGENGAGKSTLMKILAGVEQPTKGKVLLEGKEIRLKSPLDATNHGIGIIYQELTLCPNLTVDENTYLAHEIPLHGALIDRKSQKQNAQALILRLGHNISPDALVGDLRIGQQQIVEISKALARHVKILIMDEPTSALSAAEVEILFRVIRDLRSSGVSIIYISHKLSELLQIGDYVTVLRNGRVVAEEMAAAIDVPWIIERMVGRSQASLFVRQDHAIGEPILQVEDLTLPRPGNGYFVDHVSFELHQGEILGLYGLMGAGRSDLLDCLAGLRPQATGKIRLSGQEVKALKVSERIRAGIVLVPEDRQRDGLVPTLSVSHNMLLASLRKYLNGFFLGAKKQKVAVARMIKDLSIRVTTPQQLITSLSGGNQQKVIVAKGLLTTPKVLMMDEPTRGIDVGAKSEIFEIMSRLAVEGYGILFVSTELQEILGMSDRILVMSKGAITGEFMREEATEEKLVAASAIGHGLANGVQTEKGSDKGSEAQL